MRLAIITSVLLANSPFVVPPPGLPPTGGTVTGDVSCSGATCDFAVDVGGKFLADGASGDDFFGCTSNGNCRITNANVAALQFVSGQIRVTGTSMQLHTPQHQDSTPTVTLAAAATTFAATRNVNVIDCDAGGNTIATITGDQPGMGFCMHFVDASCTITDTAAATADTVNLSAAFTSTADDVLCLVHNGTKWYETSRSVN